MNLMRLACTFALFLATLTAQGPASARAHPLLSQVHKVYLLSMGGGLDQYLANQLTAKGLLEVVTDPKLADAVLTDSIGAAFEARLTELLPPPPPPKPPASEAKKDKAEEPDTGNSYVPRISTIGRGRGNLFLVELKSRTVVWSTYRLPRSRTPEDLDRVSARIAESLAQDLSKK